MWSAWATTSDTEEAPIASTLSIGHRNSGNVFFGTYPSFKTLFLPNRASLAEYLAYVERSTVWQEVI